MRKIRPVKLRRKLSRSRKYRIYVQPRSERLQQYIQPAYYDWIENDRWDSLPPVLEKPHCWIKGTHIVDPKMFYEMSTDIRKTIVKKYDLSEYRDTIKASNYIENYAWDNYRSRLQLVKCIYSIDKENIPHHTVHNTYTITLLYQFNNQYVPTLMFFHYARYGWYTLRKWLTPLEINRRVVDYAERNPQEEIERKFYRYNFVKYHSTHKSAWAKRFKQMV